MIENFSISSNSNEVLIKALGICLGDMPPVEVWEEHEGKLYFGWYGPHLKSPSKLPAKIKEPELLAGIIMPWLKDAKYPTSDEQYIDEDDTHAYRLSYSYSGIEIIPVWIHCGK